MKLYAVLIYDWEMGRVTISSIHRTMEEANAVNFEDFTVQEVELDAKIFVMTHSDSYDTYIDGVSFNPKVLEDKFKDNKYSLTEYDIL